ncbi:serine hydrolase domain-containing protein [Streptomyces sp. SID5910]|uniref:serine hydrolase domain-containing protein n=1 Tax=Streptomyces sp. SID5910 TaxID=2690312 RepID=UPI00136B301E|nr:serine hydrolase domain-containing protein [Streptomyces sp. SID5910]MYR45561.1 serine hydrolase [Streptomyces sp. SID5910]
MSDPNALRTILRRAVDEGTVPGAVALVARGDDVDVVAVGHVDTEGTAPMARDSLFRMASLTKPVVAATVMTLVDDGLLGLDDPVETWLPELAKPRVLRTPSAALDDVVPAERPITVEDLLSSRAGWGFPSDFSLPGVRALSAAHQGGLEPRRAPAPDEWLAGLARVPLLHQPGAAWLYNTCSDLQGVLIARVTGRPLPQALAERLLEPAGMTDTAFEVPPAGRGRFTSQYTPTGSGTLALADAPDGQWSSVPPFPSGAGGLVSTVDDWLAFARMLLADGTAHGRRVLSPASVRRMTTDHLTPAQREAARLFLRGQGWGYGGQVDLDRAEPWNVPGRYGWVGGSGTTAHLVPATGTTAVLLTQVAMTDPEPTPLMRAFWRCAAGV